MILYRYMNTYNKIKAIAFDKDGTLLDFHYLWVNLLEALVEKIIEENKLLEHADKIKSDVFKFIGIDNGVIDPLGVFGKGTEKEIFMAVYSGFKPYLNNISAEEFSEAISGNVTWLLNNVQNRIQAVKDGNVKELFDRLKDAGYLVGIITNDSYQTSKLSLAGLDLDTDKMDFFYTGDMENLKAKPSPEIMFDLMKKYNLKADQIIYVGDTPSDMEFAKNANVFGVGVLTGVAGKEDLSNSHITIEDIFKLEELLNNKDIFRR